MLLKADWSDDLEEEKDTQGQNKDEDNLSDIKEWDGDFEKQQYNDNQTPQPGHKSTSDTETVTPQFSKPIIRQIWKSNQSIISFRGRDRKKKLLKIH